MDQTTYWKNFRSEHPEVISDEHDAFTLGFEGDVKTNNELANLIKDGVKTGTSSALDLYALSGEKMPKAGDYIIILDGQQQPVCIILELEVKSYPLMEVSDQHAYNEGEGPRTLEYWRQVHIDFFKKEYAAYNQPFNDNIPVLCETFQVVYK
ncbi:ASCH domain-containing protein [Companilactobacillus sp.]|jgi:uncharacterized protein YhfF|uniref:ASCH domain-containing protein n=1 Tax=Companilactobacillus sp. TaxID=2767905 RepID=UPI0025C599DF|nr:ASCH domain-containing protein [Companilactobacillus sp.]MCH4008195.1 ASCH domain-containing protein [Companilactobacillus sp.]MCH4051626.1 ASCH domain-containing protein [Companilactobacillus sp.]MCH4076138.1 ASCH domain-containing protein [Companilactobacillus sp.]MCH4124713.1 ASCH domain-containing protein [Companilactobacillus sp.]MCH4131255.1 ASCH domain-containing protein [Companilactobacillus sp.]